MNFVEPFLCKSSVRRAFQKDEVNDFQNESQNRPLLKPLCLSCRSCNRGFFSNGHCKVENNLDRANF